MSKGVPCSRCCGRGTEPTALEVWDSLTWWGLRALTWPEERIAELKAELKEDEVLAGMPRWGGIEVRDPSGRVRTIDRHRGASEAAR